MSALLGERDRLIMNTVPRYATPMDRALMLTASATMFEVSLGGVPTPASITFSALMLGAVGAITFSSEPAVPLTVANGNAVLNYADMAASIVTVTASTVIEGVTYIARQTVAKQQALDLTPPPAPTGLVATGHPATITLAWDAAPANYKNLSHTEVWRAPANNFAQAALVGRADGREYTDPVGPGAFRYYWIRYVSRAAIPGPYNASSGTVGSSDAEVEHLLQVLEGEIRESQLYADLGAKIDLIAPLSNSVKDLKDVYGDTLSAAASAVAASQSVSAAATAAGEAAQAAAAAHTAAVAADLAKAAADAAAVGAGQYATQSAQSATTANTAAGNASTSAAQSSQAATNAQGSAGAASSSASTAVGAAGAAGQSATAASTSQQAAAGSVTAAGVAATASNESKLAAQAARDAAGASAGAALTSSNTATAAATAAGDSAYAASQSAITATTKAGQAAASSGSAATSETNAAGAASQAAISAQLAAESRNAAGGSATAAAQSASTASTKSTEAGQSASAANAAAVTASSASGAAALSAGEAGTAAGLAAGAAQAAGGSANAAAGSASTANTKATAAGQSATAANESAITASSASGAAALSANAAGVAAAQAGGSASAAALSATSAGTKSTEAGQSATAANNSRLAAEAAYSQANGAAQAAVNSASTADARATAAGQSATAANSARIAAEAAYGQANGAALAAVGSASTADARATAAGQSASTASAAASTATTRAADAGVFASQAAASKTLADGSASAAASSLQQVQAIYRADLTNLCPDPTFASGVQNWTAGLIPEIGDASWPFGTAARVKNRDNLQLSVQVNVSPGDVHQFSAWVYALSGLTAPTFGIGAYFTGANSFQTWIGAASCTAVDANGYWRRISGTLTVPAGARTANLWLHLEQGGEVQDKFWLATGIEWRPAQIVQALTAVVNTEIDVRASQNEASSRRIDNVQASITGPGGLTDQYAAVKIKAEATAVALGQAQAKYGVQLDVDGVAGGFELIAGGGRLDFGVRASTFFIAAPADSGIPSAIPFIVRATETIVDGVTIPIGVYIANAYIQNASITNAKIGGDIWSSNWSYGVSGWYLSRAGNLYANSVQLRGSIAGGAFTGHAWPTSLAGGFYLGSDGLLLGNYFTGQYFQVDANGDVYSPGLTISNGVATFSGALAAATGSFKGELVAATGTFGLIRSATSGQRAEFDGNGTRAYYANGQLAARFGVW